MSESLTSTDQAPEGGRRGRAPGLLPLLTRGGSEPLQEAPAWPDFRDKGRRSHTGFVTLGCSQSANKAWGQVPFAATAQGHPWWPKKAALTSHRGMSHRGQVPVRPDRPQQASGDRRVPWLLVGAQDWWELGVSPAAPLGIFVLFPPSPPTTSPHSHCPLLVPSSLFKVRLEAEGVQVPGRTPGFAPMSSVRGAGGLQPLMWGLPPPHLLAGT